MLSLRERDRPGFGYHLKVHSFRTFTVLLAWGLIVAAFYQKPELLTGAQRLMQRGMKLSATPCLHLGDHEWNSSSGKSEA